MRNNCSQVVLENFFEPGILYLLLKKPSYGYELQKDLSKKCICEINTGNLYRCLARFQKNGYITKKSMLSEIGPKRYIYTITQSGKKYLSKWMDMLKKQNKVISSLIKNYQKII